MFLLNIPIPWPLKQKWIPYEEFWAFAIPSPLKGKQIKIETSLIQLQVKTSSVPCNNNLNVQLFLYEFL